MKTTSDKPQLATLPELARRYGLGIKTIRRLAAEEAFPTYQIGRAWPRVRVSEFEAWLRSTQTPASDAGQGTARRAARRRRSRDRRLEGRPDHVEH